ncbi:hypothetical protein NliqN6_3121 [Naganishia liquefaciens]|uniref:BZIP domain-containing protein n=1 Tax=Naganishia liquefaciens TaxID=104408 RepID=A0A8H3TV48_9TREE|nr:hypothetical protein NliqN6_3121 [Naganishia liquefaciens]
MSEAQTLIDDIAAEYPDLRDHEDEQPFHHGIPGDEDAQGEAEGDGGQPGDMSGLTDEALRQFANAAAMHYELGREGETPSHGKEGQGADDEDAVEGLASGDAYGGNGGELGEPGQVVVSGSIPPPPRPTYETTHPTHRRIDPQEMATLQEPASAASKRKRPSDEETFEQPLQAQGPPRGKKQHRMDLVDTGMIDPSIANSPDAAAGVLSPRDLAQANIYTNTASSSRIPPALVIAPQPTHQAHAARGRKPSARHDEMMTMGITADPAAEVPDTGRKENKDERSARRAEQNRRAQQNFRKRREETMKQQEARLKELEPQLEALQRQQAETQLLLEALKLENTALRAVLIHSVKQGARILDAQGELIGSATAIGLVDSTTEDDVQSQTQPDLDGTETEKNVNDVYAALDRLGARTHVYARTIVPVVTEDPTFPSAPRHPESNPAHLGGVAQSSMRTVPHASHPHAGPSSIAQQRDTPHAFPTTNLPPFPSGPQSHPQHQQPQIEEPSSSTVAQIDPTLGAHGHPEHTGDDSLMMVDAETGLALPD